jgi:hypothetical protein
MDTLNINKKLQWLSIVVYVPRVVLGSLLLCRLYVVFL